MSNTAIIEKIQKVLALAASAEGTPEGMVAAKMADKLLREHALTMAEIEDVSGPEEIETNKFDFAQTTWQRSLLNVVCRYCSCRSYYYQGSKRVAIVGFPHDVEVAKYLLKIISDQILAESKAYTRARPWMSRGEKRQYGNGFRRSAVQGVRAKLQALKEESSRSDETGTALVLNRSKRVDQWLEENVTLSSSRSVTRSTFSQAGYAAGQNVSLHKGISGSSRNKLA